MVAESAVSSTVRQVVESVPDPELPWLTLGDLGVVREIAEGPEGIEVIITPTYTGCPATEQIMDDIRSALADNGHRDARVSLRLSPAWTTDDVTEAGRRKMLANGVAPPAPSIGRSGDRSHEVPVAIGDRFAPTGTQPELTCPRCGSHDTEIISPFGATACKALARCLDCREPFEWFKPL